MKLGLMLGYSGKRIDLPLPLIQQAEQLGFHSVWTAEAYGADAVTPAAWILAQTQSIHVGTCIMQMPARTPALAAMTAMTLDQLSGGRFIVGLGASGPQVVEGWHGVPYGKPITRTREYIQIMRAIFAREAPVSLDGNMYQLPATGAGASGLGKPLKPILAAAPRIPIYSAAITPSGLACAAEMADGVFPIWLAPEQFNLIDEHLQAGFARRPPSAARRPFDVAPGVPVALGEDLDRCRAPIKQFLALYIGGMGARDKNFYADYAGRMGFGEAAQTVQQLYLQGDKDKAAAAVPDALVDAIALIGPPERIRERAVAWREIGAAGKVGSLLFHIRQPEVLPLLADIFL